MLGVRGEIEERFPRLSFSLPLGMVFRYSVSPRWAMPTPAVCPCFAMETASGLEIKLSPDNLQSVFLSQRAKYAEFTRSDSVWYNYEQIRGVLGWKQFIFIEIIVPLNTQKSEKPVEAL